VAGIACGFQQFEPVDILLAIETPIGRCARWNDRFVATFPSPNDVGLQTRVVGNIFDCKYFFPFHGAIVMDGVDIVNFLFKFCLTFDNNKLRENHEKTT
jgi:hypothetical protein